MLLKYDIDIDNKAICIHLKKMTNQIYKLLPSREEGSDWEKTLKTILEEFSGMGRLFLDHQSILFSLICKLEGLFLLTEQEDFLMYRKTIFECLSLVNELIKVCQD